MSGPEPEITDPPPAKSPGSGEPSAAEKSAANDAPPKAKKGPGRPKGSTNKKKAATGSKAAPTESASIRTLRAQLEEILTGPAFLFEMQGEPWPAQHVDQRGKVLAKELADLASRNPEFKARLERLLEGGENTKLIIAAAMYIAPLAIYFGVLPVPERVKITLQIPDRIPSVQTGPPVMPQELKEKAEAEAVRRGFVNGDGEPDMDAFLKVVANEMAEGTFVPVNDMEA